MADDSEIPQHLIDLQRKYDAADAAVRAAPDDLSQDQLDQLRQKRLDITNELVAARKGTEWESWAGQRKIHAAARSTE